MKKIEKTKFILSIPDEKEISKITKVSEIKQCEKFAKTKSYEVLMDFTESNSNTIMGILPKDYYKTKSYIRDKKVEIYDTCIFKISIYDNRSNLKGIIVLALTDYGFVLTDLKTILNDNSYSDININKYELVLNDELEYDSTYLFKIRFNAYWVSQAGYKTTGESSYIPFPLEVNIMGIINHKDTKLFDFYEYNFTSSRFSKNKLFNNIFLEKLLEKEKKNEKIAEICGKIAITALSAALTFGFKKLRQKIHKNSKK